LDNIISVGAGVRIARWQLLEIRDDQWQLGMRQLKLEEIWIKFDFRVWTPEEGAEAMTELPELELTELSDILHRSTYERWKAKQAKIAGDQRKKKEKGKEKQKMKALGPKVGEEAEAELMEPEGGETVK